MNTVVTAPQHVTNKVHEIRCFTTSCLSNSFLQISQTVVYEIIMIGLKNAHQDTQKIKDWTVKEFFEADFMILDSWNMMSLDTTRSRIYMYSQKQNI